MFVIFDTSILTTNKKNHLKNVYGSSWRRGKSTKPFLIEIVVLIEFVIRLEIERIRKKAKRIHCFGMFNYTVELVFLHV